MRDRLADFGDNTDVVLITFTDPTNLPAYRREHQLEIQLLVDPDRSTYHSFGLRRGTVWRVWGIRAARKYVELLRQDGLRGLARPTEDTLQLGGDFIIDPDGVLIYGFWGDGPDDRPPVDALIRAVHAGQQR